MEEEEKEFEHPNLSRVHEAQDGKKKFNPNLVYWDVKIEYLFMLVECVLILIQGQMHITVELISSWMTQNTILYSKGW